MWLFSRWDKSGRGRRKSKGRGWKVSILGTLWSSYGGSPELNRGSFFSHASLMKSCFIKVSETLNTRKEFHLKKWHVLEIIERSFNVLSSAALKASRRAFCDHRHLCFGFVFWNISSTFIRNLSAVRIHSARQCRISAHIRQYLVLWIVWIFIDGNLSDKN